ncbi:MAG: VWA domain-containing protein, partial [Kineosporiaceae bacterium]
MRRHAWHPRGPAAAVRVVTVLALLGLPAVLAPLGASPAAAAGGVQVVTVMRGVPSGASAVVQIDPAPLAALGADAVSVSAGGPPKVARVLDLTVGTPTALVVDASSAAAGALPQALSGAAGLLLKMPDDDPVTVVADKDPPALLTTDGATAGDAIRALTTISASGNSSTTAALSLALQHLGARQDALRLVVLTTSGAPPGGDDATRLVDAMRAAGAVLAVVGTGSAGTSWSLLATRTGGTAVAAQPTDAAAAYDTLAATLQARYVVTFTPPPSATQAKLYVTSAGVRMAAAVDLRGVTTAATGSATASPASATTTPARAAATSGGSSGGSPVW